MAASLFSVAILAVRTNKFTVIDRACASRNVPQIQETYRSLPLPSYGAALKGLSSPEQPAFSHAYHAAYCALLPCRAR